MAVAYNYKKGIDNPSWQWMAMFPGGNSNSGTSQCYDGSRYIYWLVQVGTTAVTASTTQLWRYDTWNNGWQFLATTTSGNQGMDLEYDATRNVVYIINGVSLTSWSVFNLNTTAVTIANVSCAAFTLTSIGTVLPAAPLQGASITMPQDIGVPSPIDSGVADATGNTTTVVQATPATASFGPGMVGLQVRVTSGTQNGSVRTISAVSAPNALTLAVALGGALASGDTFVIEMQGNTATAGTASTLSGPANATWTTNFYSNMDVVITAGTGAGQRRRIASNTANVLTVAAAVTGNARTGNFSVTPDATSVYKIVPSADFLYYQPGNGTTTFYRIDVAQTTGVAWSAALGAPPGGISGGGNTLYPSAYAPYSIVALRGSATGSVYLYNIGLNTWSTVNTFTAGDVFNLGASSAIIPGKKKLLVQVQGATRIYAIDLLTGIAEPIGTMPYAAPSAVDGKRARVVNTPDGAQFLYIMRAGGPELFRVPLEWL